MKVFISWSGERSQILAQALRDWLPLVLHYVEPWISQSDIEAGERWANEVAKELEASNFGLICVTRENVTSPWILFEAGALAKSMQDGRVIPLLLDLEFKDITGPLAQFQAKKAEKPSVMEIAVSINRLCPQPIPDDRLHQLFEALWPELEKRIIAVPKHGTPAKNRPQHEILEELVTSIRGLDLRFRETIEEGPRTKRRRSGFHPMLMEEMLHVLDVEPGDPVRLLMLSSMLRDDLPWLYELGMEAYRAATTGNAERTKKAQHRFMSALHTLRRGPFLEDIGDPRTTHMLLREMEHLLNQASRERPSIAEGLPKGQKPKTAS